MTMIWLKFAHMAAIAIWGAGLVVLPGLYVRRASLDEGDDLYRLHRFARFIYVGVVSPAAFVAVATGIALVFAQQTFVAWFSVKLALVGGLVFTHVLTGLVIIRLFTVGETYPAWRFVAVTAMTTTLIIAILTVVLAKPVIPNLLPPAFAEPGALRDLVAPFNPFR